MDLGCSLLQVNWPELTNRDMADMLLNSLVWLGYRPDLFAASSAAIRADFHRQFHFTVMPQ